MSGDLKIHESIRVLAGRALSVERAGRAEAEWERVSHHYGPLVSIGETAAAAAATAAAAPLSREARGGLDEIGRHGVEAFQLRESAGFKKAKASRPHDGLSWAGAAAAGLRQPDPPHDHPARASLVGAQASALAAASPTSSRLSGKVAVGIVIVSGPGGLAFSSAEQTKVIAEVQNGLSWLGSQNNGGRVSFYYDIHHVALALPDDPGGADKEGYWRNPAMAKLGYSANWAGVQAYVEKLRSTLKTDWAYCAFFVKYSLDWFAYAALGGPRLVMQYSNDGWGPDNIDRVFAHESGHIFNAPDEYASSGCNCTSKSGYFKQLNGNCSNCSGGGKECIMNANSWTMCHYTPWHLGFRWPDGNRINTVDSTPEAPAACVFNNQNYVFWKSNDSGNRIYFSASGDGLAWPKGRTINSVDKTPASPAACVFNNKLYLFWKANDAGNRIYFSASPNGVVWAAGKTINAADSTPKAPAAVVFKNKLYVFWKSNDAGNKIYYSASPNGLSWPKGKTVNTVDSTPEALAAAVFGNKLYLFWKANDPGNKIYFSASADGVTWPAGKTVNAADSTPQALAAVVFNNELCLFWKANDPGNRIYFSASANGQSWPNGTPVNAADHTPKAPAACVFNYSGTPNPYLFWKADDSGNAIYFSP